MKTAPISEKEWEYIDSLQCTCEQLGLEDGNCPNCRYIIMRCGN